MNSTRVHAIVLPSNARKGFSAATRWLGVSIGFQLVFSHHNVVYHRKERERYKQIGRTGNELMTSRIGSTSTDGGSCGLWDRKYGYSLKSNHRVISGKRFHDHVTSRLLSINLSQAFNDGSARYLELLDLNEYLYYLKCCTVVRLHTKTIHSEQNPGLCRKT